MRPQGQRKIDEALADSNEKSGDRTTEPQGWGDVNLRPPGAPRAKKRSETKLAIGAPPPPAGAAMEEEADPVAGLFASDKAVPAPGINDSPSEAEIGRWVATSHASLFEERVKDPAPTAPPLLSEEPLLRRPSNPNPLELDDSVAIPGMTEPKPAPRKPRAAAAASPAAVADTVLAMQAPAPPSAPAAPAAPAKSKSKNRVGSASGARKRAAVAAAASEPEPSAQPKDDEDLLPIKGRRRRIEAGPSKGLLIGLGGATLLLLVAALVLLGVMPNPFGDSPAPAQQVRGGAPARGKPVAAKPAAAAPVATKPAAPAAVAAKPTAAAKPAAAAAKAGTAVPAAPIAAKPVPASAAVAAPAPAPRAPVPAARVEAPAAEAAPARPSSDEGDDAEAGSGSGKLSQARKLLAAENPEAAEAIARQVLAADPQDHHAMDVLARSLMDQDRGAEALPMAQKMVARRGKRVPYRLLLGDLLLMVGKEAEARAEWQKALELAPSDKEIQRRLGK
jgi:hypothetical protein